MAKPPGVPARTTARQRLLIALAWLYVGIPLAWGVSQTAFKSIALFR